MLRTSATAPQLRFAAILLALCWLAVSTGPAPAQAQEDASAFAGRIKAPTHLYHEPNSYLLLPLGGLKVNVRYTPGSLDRAANLQTRLHLLMRSFDRQVKAKLGLHVYVLSREEWEQAQYDIIYGLPLRVGKLAIAAPAAGDEGTVELWSELLDGLLPKVPGVPLRGTPEQVATMAIADILVQLQAAEILVDELGLAGDAHWVRGLVTHVASLDFFRRHDPARVRDLESMYYLLNRERALKSLSAADYGPDLALRDWFWFQAQFHAGASAILDKTGKGAMKKIRKLRNKDGAVLRGERLLKAFKDLEVWYRATFSAVSRRTDR